jgi:hypothetical protein
MFASPIVSNEAAELSSFLAWKEEELQTAVAATPLSNCTELSTVGAATSCAECIEPEDSVPHSLWPSTLPNLSSRYHPDISLRYPF